jgi:hypothetical protein
MNREVPAYPFMYVKGVPPGGGNFIMLDGVERPPVKVSAQVWAILAPGAGAGEEPVPGDVLPAGGPASQQACMLVGSGSDWPLGSIVWIYCGVRWAHH